MRVADSFRTMSADKRCADIQDTMKPLQRLTAIFSLDCCVPKTQCQKLWLVSKAFVSAFVIGCATFYTLYIKIRYYYNNTILSIKLTDFIQMCYDYSQYIVDLFFVFKYGRETYVEYYKQYANFDQYLAITDYTAIKIRLINLITFFAFLWIVTSVFDYTTWALSNGILLPTIYSPSYIFLLLKIFNTLDHISHVMHIEFRLKCIANQLQDCYYAAKDCPGDFSDPVANANWFYCASPSKTVGTEMSKRLASRDIKGLSRCYLLIIEQSVFINKMFGTRILLNSLSLLIDMIRFTNIAFRLVIGTQPTLYASGYYPAAANMLRMVTCAVVVGSLSSQCERAYRQRDTAISIIDLTLISKDPDADLRAKLTELRDLIQSRRVEFHTAYFFRLDYAFLVSLVSVMVTYTIILIQNLN